MLTLLEYFTSLLYIPKTTYGITRKEMPQIHDLEDFVEWMNTQGIEYEYEIAEVYDLKPTQSEFDEFKVLSIMDDDKDFITKGTFIVSNDDYILDGHHRWLALLNINITTKVNIIRTKVNIQELLLKANGYHKTTSQDI